MRWVSCLLLVLLLGAGLPAQELPPVSLPTQAPLLPPAGDSKPWADDLTDGLLAGTRDGLLGDRDGPAAGTQGFSNFIGFMSNPLQNIDPRSLTQVWPIFLSGWTNQFGPLPSADFQLYGAGMNLAITDRFSVGLNQGGLAAIHTAPVNPNSQIGQLIAARRDLGGQSRVGFLNLGGFAQYTLIADAESQFLFTAGTRVEAPSGSHDVFQGTGPAYLSPYLTAGKGLGNFHLLATTGYKFPLRSGNSETRTFYANGHLDYQLLGWIYPLVEVNWLRAEHTRDINLPLRGGFFDLDNFSATGEVVTLSVGANFVLIRDALEVGGCWSTPLYTKRDFDFNTLLLKMILRF